MRYNKIGIIGAGNIGIGVATDLILHNIKTVLIDVSGEILKKAKSEIEKNLRFAPLYLKNLKKFNAEEIQGRLSLCTSIEKISDCEFIIENVTEDWDIKQKVYHQLNDLTPPDVCFGVNTSCISITKVGSITTKPDKVVGIHFMNPVYLKSTVEVIKGFHTSDETLNNVKLLFEQLDKSAIIVNDYPGFVSNRISHLFMNEAAFVLQDQVASAKDIDDIFKKCFGHKMGPLETADLIGLDTVMYSLDILYNSYGDPKFRCCPLLRKLVYAGNLGRKTGRGFYEYPEI
ncbi:MAG TPA: 3-hydroxyacyl-CoA dehydrogenase NAD-binding domain-containing protein [Ignavibacteriaceae bacterium]|nr:3-hydroxyacyl-CoA dehydrogenase NAD-binding domain-containing protein [Ignavibacteriaceae bacterium]